MAYFTNDLRPVSFTAKPLPGRGAPGVQSIFSTPNDFSSEVYPHNRLGRFVVTADAPRSTLAPRNDTSAYPLLRRFLADGGLPPIGVLRIESLIDYFTPMTSHSNASITAACSSSTSSPETLSASRVATGGRTLPRSRCSCGRNRG